MPLHDIAKTDLGVATCPKCNGQADYLSFGEQDGDDCITEHYECKKCNTRLVARYRIVSVYHEETETLYEQK